MKNFGFSYLLPKSGSRSSRMAFFYEKNKALKKSLKNLKISF